MVQLVLIASCVPQEKTEYIRMKRLSPPEIIAEDGKAKILPGGFVKRRLRLGHPSLKNIIIHDRRYLHITKKWFKDVMNRTEELIAHQVPGIGKGKPYPVAYMESFSSLASNIANISVAKRYNLKDSVLIGLVVAENKLPWGKIPVDGSSQGYIIGLTSEIAIIYDVFTGQSIKSSDFPNLESVTGIVF